MEDFDYNNSPNFTFLRGYQIRTGFRKYGGIERPSPLGGFWEVSLSYRRAAFGVPGDFLSNDGSSFRRINYDVVQQDLRLIGFLGMSLPISPRFYVEMGTGLGGNLQIRDFRAVNQGFMFLSNGSLWLEYQEGQAVAFLPAISILFSLGMMF